MLVAFDTFSQYVLALRLGPEKVPDSVQTLKPLAGYLLQPLGREADGLVHTVGATNSG